MKSLRQQKVWHPQVADGCDWFGCVRLAPDGKSIAFAVRQGDTSRLLVEDQTGDVREVGLFEDALGVEDIRFAPGGDRVAVLLAEDDSAFCKRVALVHELGEEGIQWPGQMTATSMAWHPDAQRLAVYDAHSQTALMYSAERRVQLLGRGRDAGERRFAPQLCFRPDGSQLALALRSVFDAQTTIWVAGLVEGRFEQSVLSDVPGHEVHLRTFWSYRGRSLGVLLCDEEHEQSAIMLFRGAEGGGKLVYSADVVDVPSQPVWSPDAKHVLWFRSSLSDGFPATLSCLDVDTGDVRDLLEPDAASGDLWLSQKSVLVADGDEAVYHFTVEI